MKKTVIITIAIILCSYISLAQSPQAFRYQAVARDAAGITLANQAVGFRISILKDGPTGTNVYSETHSVTTNFYGLASFDIGAGSVVSGDFSAIDWGNGSYYIQIEMDASGGTSYELMGNSKLISVPYSLHASKAAYINGFNELQDSVYNLYVEVDDDSAFLKGLIDQNALDIATETANRISADNILQSQIVNESYERIAADNALQDSIDAEEARRILADQQILAELDADSTFLKGLIDDNTTAINNINLELDSDSAYFQALIDTNAAHIAQLNVELDSDSTFLKGLIDQNATDIAAETAARVAADQALQDSIDAEEARRMLADQQIHAEMNADSAFLKGLIDDNTTAINNINLELDADSAYFQAQIDTNAAHIAQLNVELDADSTFLKGLIDQNATDIANETAARIAADQALQDSIDLEEARRIAADQALHDSIVAERNARIAAGYLTTEIDGDTTNEIQVLSISNDTIFLSNGGHAKLPAGSTVTLDDAYDEGGSGAGRETIADNGAVLISGTDGIISTGTVNGGATLSISGAGTRMIWYPRKAAFRAGFVSGDHWNDGKTGKYSVALGKDCEASYENSVVIGGPGKAWASQSVALGEHGVATGNRSTTIGNTYADGDYSLAFGKSSIAEGNYSIAGGYKSRVYSGGWVSVSIGYENSVHEEYSVAFGKNTNASGYYSFAFGAGTSATTRQAFAGGYKTNASGIRSIALGYQTTAGSDESSAFGYKTVTNNSSSIVMGSNTTTNNSLTAAFGSHTTAEGWYSVAVGEYNVGDFSNKFEIGIGTSSQNKNALTVRRIGTSKVGIGTSTPSYALHVTGYNTSASQSYAYLRYHPTKIKGKTSGSANYSIVATYRMRAKEFHAVSDERIKTNFKINTGNENLDLINRIEVTDYTYIDTVDHGNAYKKGFIAQQVEDVIPGAVCKSYSYIPDIYSRTESVVCDPDNKILIISISKEHGLIKGDLVKIFNDNAEFKVEVLEVLSTKSFQIEEIDGDYSRLFIFGKQVDDFRSIDYDQVFTAGIGAIQELSRRNEKLKEDIQGLQVENDILQIEEKELQASDKELRLSNQKMQERIKRIEKLLGAGSDNNSAISYSPTEPETINSDKSK